MSIEAKAARLYHSGAVGYVGDGNYLVAGDHDTYSVVWLWTGFACDCPSARRCSHVLATVLAARAREATLHRAKIVNNEAEGEANGQT